MDIQRFKETSDEGHVEYGYRATVGGRHVASATAIWHSASALTDDSPHWKRLAVELGAKLCDDDHRARRLRLSGALTDAVGAAWGDPAKLKALCEAHAVLK